MKITRDTMKKIVVLLETASAHQPKALSKPP
jgi:hypothetical protein